MELGIRNGLLGNRIQDIRLVIMAKHIDVLGDISLIGFEAKNWISVLMLFTSLHWHK